MKIRHNVIHYLWPGFFAFCILLTVLAGEIGNVFLVLVIVLFCVLHRQSRYLALKDNIITGKTGLIKIQKMTSPVNKIQYCSYTQFLCFNKIEINAITGRYKFKNMAHAKEFVQLVNSEMAK